MARPETKQRKNPAPDLLDRINAYCKEHRMSFSQVMENARASQIRIGNLRDGSQFNPKTLHRIDVYLSGKPVDLIRVEKPKLNRVSGRDSCFRCETRGDIGCKHQRAGEGRSFYA